MPDKIAVVGSNLEEARKSVERARELSLQARAKPDGAWGGQGLLLYILQAGELVSPWWSKARDVDLDAFWKQSDHVSGALAMLAAKVVTVPVRAAPRDSSVKAHAAQAEDFTVRLVEEAEFGESWIQCLSKWLLDFWAGDNGGFFEVIGPSKSSKCLWYDLDGRRAMTWDHKERGRTAALRRDKGETAGPVVGPAEGLAHLDSSRCTRTGDPEWPVRYQDTDGSMFRYHATRVAFAADLPSPRAGMNGVGFCLHGNSTVLMANGKCKSIRRIVRERDPGPVLSYKNGRLVPRKIISWYENDRLERRMINLRGEKTRRRSGSRERNTWVTEDHPVLTPRGWVKAGELHHGDEIITDLPYPNHRQMSVLIGTLLGDGNIDAKGNATVRLVHKHSAEEWLRLKTSALSDFSWSFSYQKNGLYAWTRACPTLNDVRSAFYRKGSGKKEILPLSLVKEYIGPELLVSWYLDDGKIQNRDKGKRKPSAVITTWGYELSDLKKVCEIITEAGYECNPVKDGGGYSIYFTVSGSEKLFKLIAPFVPICMRYKLPPGATEFDPALWNMGKATRFIDIVSIGNSYQKPPRLRQFPKKVYCVDVEDTHNFVTGGLVVHNCALSRAVNNAQHLIDVGVYKGEKLGSRPKRAIIVAKRISTDVVTGAFADADEMMDNQGLRRFSKVPVIGDLESDADLSLLDLASLPDGFDEETSTRLGMFTLALAFGVPIRWIWPAAVSGATKADAMYQHIAGLGGGIGRVLRTLEVLLGGDPRGAWHSSGKFLPPHLKLVFDFQDDEQDRARAEIQKVRSETRVADLAAGIYTVRVAREKALADGDLTRAQFERMELADGRLPGGEDVLTAFHSGDRELGAMVDLGVPDPLDVARNDRAAVLEAIEEKMSEARTALSSAPSAKSSARARQALAALSKLHEVYEGAESGHVRAAEGEQEEGRGGEGKKESPFDDGLAESAHHPERVRLLCPMPGCDSQEADLYTDHGGLCVCVKCRATFDPEVEL